MTHLDLNVDINTTSVKSQNQFKLGKKNNKSELNF